ncbi:unnamed protein product [Brassica oleracea var. botrytis]
MCCGFHYNCHVSQEQEMDSVLEVWNLATEPAFMCYGSLIIGAAVFLIIRFCPQYGQANVMVYSGNECKSTWNNSIGYICVTSDNPVELLKQIALTAFHLQALDTFNTAIVSLLYYVMLTSLTILASVIMFIKFATDCYGYVITGSPVILPLRRSKHTDKDGFESEDIPLRRQESLGLTTASHKASTFFPLSRLPRTWTLVQEDRQK